MAVPAKWKKLLSSTDLPAYETEYEAQKAMGHPKGVAAANTIAKLGALPLKPCSTPAVSKAGLSTSVDKGDFSWVYANMMAKRVSVESAPSHGAYALWELCQTDEGKKLFFDKFFPKIAKDTLEDDDTFSDDDRELHSTIEKLLKIKSECSSSPS